MNIYTFYDKIEDSIHEDQLRLIHSMDARHEIIRSVKFTHAQCFIKKI